MIVEMCSMTRRCCRHPQTLQDFHQLFDVGHVQPHGRLVEHIQRVLALAARDIHAKRVGATFASSATSLILWLSPPESVGLG